MERIFLLGGFRRAFVIACILSMLGCATIAGAAGAEPNLVTAIQDVAKMAIPSVVHVEVTEKQEIANPLMPFQNDPFFHYFFGNPKMPKKSERIVTGLGSGIIMDGGGHILTNSHVVNGATKINVVLSDGRRYAEDAVKVIGIDTKTDLAVIQILDKESFPFATFGDSDKVEIGQWVVAIGHPQGLDQTVTQGIISAKHRHGMADPSSYQDFLQTDAAINPGNSGGPLLTLTGEVIGVNAAIVSGSGGFEGIGFAIPSNMAVNVAKQLISKGKVERGWLGVTIQDITPDLAKSFGLPNTRGVLVADVLKDSPAYRAGVRSGDVILKLEGKNVQNSDEFRNEVAASAIGSSISISTWRDGKMQDMHVELASDQEHQKSLQSSVTERFGVVVRPLNEKEIKRYDLGAEKGVAVSKVLPKGPFGKVGIEPGDIIVKIGEQVVTGPDEFAALLSMASPQGKIVIGVVDHRTGKGGFLRVEVP
jgi:serine protease Do